MNKDKFKEWACRIFGHIPKKDGALWFCDRCGKTLFSVRRY